MMVRSGVDTTIAFPQRGEVHTPTSWAGVGTRVERRLEKLS